ncbi:pectin acetylesterase 8-like [Apium graveolens]|uniref:pectin acetylesterase 8-like n=1 Tax=Apium graveolens TaxID=4045 RepID=UPI003D7BBF48
MKMGSINQIVALVYIVFHGLQAMANAPDLIKLQSAVANGAVCLDGSPPAYQLDWGKEEGAKNWLLHLQGGYWCTTTEECRTRMNDSSGLGSSTKMKSSYFTGILSNNRTLNPYFFNWNRVYVRYCDGSCFTGDKQESAADGPYYRGGRIFSAIMDELSELGMKNAPNVLLSGSSAGGLGAMLHCDRFRNHLPTFTKVKCLSDASYFVTLNNPSGFVELHGSATNLPVSCTSKMDTTLCLYPSNVVPDIQTPLFLLNSAFDTFQIAATIRLPAGSTRSCLYNLTGCPTTVQKQWKNFRLKIMQEVTMGNLSRRGLFINACHTHSQSEFQSKWLGDPNSMLDHMTISDAVGKWFNDEELIQLIDRKHRFPQQCVLDASEPNACNNYTWGASHLCNVEQVN